MPDPAALRRRLEAIAERCLEPQPIHGSAHITAAPTLEMRAVAELASLVMEMLPAAPVPAVADAPFQVAERIFNKHSKIMRPYLSSSDYLSLIADIAAAIRNATPLTAPMPPPFHRGG